MNTAPIRRVRQGVPYDREQIRLKRIERGLSQARLAELTGLSTSQISGIETGYSGPSAGSLAEIARVLRCKVSDLMTKVPR